MPVISFPQAFNEEELFIDLRSIFGHSLFLKCEGFNFAGSIKLKAAIEMVEAAERNGVLTPGWSILVESSSGNLGVALSMIAASKGYRFLCVTDLRCNQSTRLLMEALGSQVHVITEPDANGGGLLGARLAYVRALCGSDDRYVWLGHPSAAARRVLCGRGGTRRGGRHHPCLPSSSQKGLPVRRLHRHGGQRRDGLVGPA
jgi:cysteine synthase